MKYLELTEEKANNLNDICKFAIEKGINNTFDITDYQSKNQSFDISYYKHLLDVAKQYEGINKLIDLSVNYICATHNTSHFLKCGGFLRILKIEQRGDDIQEYTLSTLRQSTLGTKEWLRLLFITISVAIITSLLTDKLSGKNLQQDTTQDSLLKSLTTYILHRDSLNFAYYDSLKFKK